jgi:hypothetical protein
VTFLLLAAWYMLATAWAYAQGRSTTSGILETWWHYHLGVVLLLQPLIWMSRGWLQLLVSLPLILAAVVAWPMAVRVAHRVSAHVERRQREQGHPTPASVARERARGPELEACTRDMLEIVREAG